MKHWTSKQYRYTMGGKLKYVSDRVVHVLAGGLEIPQHSGHVGAGGGSATHVPLLITHIHLQNRRQGSTMEEGGNAL
jgi:hypothetical protein